MSDERFYSVKEFAELAGISSQAVYQRLGKDLQSFTKQVGKRKMVSEQALKFFGIKEKPSNLQSAYQEKPSNLVSTLQATIEALQGQLDVKDKQIEELNARLAEAQAMAQANAVLASQAQQLQAIETQERQERRRKRWFRSS